MLLLFCWFFNHNLLREWMMLLMLLHNKLYYWTMSLVITKCYIYGSTNFLFIIAFSVIIASVLVGRSSRCKCWWRQENIILAQKGAKSGSCFIACVWHPGWYWCMFSSSAYRESLIVCLLNVWLFFFMPHFYPQ